MNAPTGIDIINYNFLIRPELRYNNNFSYFHNSIYLKKNKSLRIITDLNNNAVEYTPTNTPTNTLEMFFSYF